MYLYAQGEYVDNIVAELPELKELLVAAIGQPIRRISRFMQLALIGAGRCARERELSKEWLKETAVYLASSRGDLDISIDVMGHVFRDGQAPKPLSFVNTVSNSAAFYVAKCLGLESRSTFASSRYFAFENALQLAHVDLALGVVRSALLGTVDTVTLPLQAHRRRLEIDADVTVAEASHWLWVGRDAQGESLGRIVEVQTAFTRERLLDWLTALPLERSATAISAGQYLSADDFESIRGCARCAHVFDYRATRGYYGSQSAAAVAAFAEKHPCRTLLHINADPLGRYAVVLFEARG